MTEILAQDLQVGDVWFNELTDEQHEIIEIRLTPKMIRVEFGDESGARFRKTDVVTITNR